jgi:AbrB family looped-hinge helix DNA binding protein
MTHKVGPKGQVVLPKDMRDELGIAPGDEVMFNRADDRIVVRKARTKAEILDDLRGSMAGSGLLEDYMQEKQLDREREIRKYGRY